MNENICFKKSVIVSFMSHAFLFVAMTLSIGKNVPAVQYSSISFLGPIVSGSDLAYSLRFIPSLKAARDIPVQQVFAKRFTASMPFKTYRPADFEIPHVYVKPAVFALAGAVKQDMLPADSSPVPSVKKETAITFHPDLPQHFILYFNNRQTAHIELLFNVMPASEKRNIITVKRKISSGNLEFDLLTRRYIGHYLFIQGNRFTPNKWQTVKIDLSPGEK